MRIYMVTIRKFCNSACICGEKRVADPAWLWAPWHRLNKGGFSDNLCDEAFHGRAALIWETAGVMLRSVCARSGGWRVSPPFKATPNGSQSPHFPVTSSLLPGSSLLRLKLSVTLSTVSPVLYVKGQKWCEDQVTRSCAATSQQTHLRHYIICRFYFKISISLPWRF